MDFQAEIVLAWPEILQTTGGKILQIYLVGP